MKIKIINMNWSYGQNKVRLSATVDEIIADIQTRVEVGVI